jgi:hypothetical protein
MPYDRESERAELMAKIRPKIRHDFEDLDAMGEKDLKQKIVECEANLMETSREEKTDKKLAAAKEKVKELVDPYKRGKERLTKMMEYATLRLEELGKA